MTAPSSSRTSDLVVVGAGAMGSWTAFWAQTGGRQTALIDAWGAGHARATSGDETRITRAAHGSDHLYTQWSRRSREHFLHYQEEWGVRLFVPAGVLWFAHRDDAFEAATIPVFEAQGVPHERLTPQELQHRWPQLGIDDGLRFALYEPEGGALMARRGCQVVTEAFGRAGGTFDIAGIRPGRTEGGRLLEVVDGSGATWSGETFVFAAGPWLPGLFPDVLDKVIRVTKQDIMFIGQREGDTRFSVTELPAWCDYDAAYYGIPAVDDRGFKLAPDRYGPIFDPSNGERVVDLESVRLVRRYLARRFPALAKQPIVESRVCQYESTIDANFLIAQHPELSNVWLVGGGSGHGYKHGPRIGEYLVARLNDAAEGDQHGEAEQRFRIGPRTPGSAARTGGDDMARTWDLF